MKIYIAHQITGLTPKEVIDYFEGTADRLRAMGYEVYQPMTAKGYFRPKKNSFGSEQKVYEKEGYRFPPSTNHAIFERDKWMVSFADLVLVDLSAAKAFSIGCTMELAWASLLGKHTILVMDEDNPHRHAFVLEAADIIWPSLEDAMVYLETFAQQKVGG